MRGKIPTPCPHVFGTYTVTQDNESFECCKECHDIIFVPTKWNYSDKTVTISTGKQLESDKYIKVFEDYLGENYEEI